MTYVGFFETQITNTKISMSNFKFYPGQMNLTEVNAGVDAFKQNFYPSGTGPNTLGNRFTFGFDDIQGLVKETGIENDRAVIVIYPGLKRNGTSLQEAYGLRIVALGAVANSIGSNVYNLVPALSNGSAGAAPTHEFNGTKIVPITGDWSAEMNEYASQMRVRRTGTPGSEIGIDYNNNDPKAFHFQWSTNLEVLYNDNKRALGAPDARLRICMRGYSMQWLRANDVNQDFFLGPDGYRHSVVFHVEFNNGTTWADQINNDTPYGSFVNQALDRTTYCPPHCKPKKVR